MKKLVVIIALFMCAHMSATDRIKQAINSWQSNLQKIPMIASLEQQEINAPLESPMYNYALQQKPGMSSAIILEIAPTIKPPKVFYQQEIQRLKNAVTNTYTAIANTLQKLKEGKEKGVPTASEQLDMLNEWLQKENIQLPPQ